LTEQNYSREQKIIDSLDTKPSLCPHCNESFLSKEQRDTHQKKCKFRPDWNNFVLLSSYSDWSAFAPGAIDKKNVIRKVDREFRSLAYFSGDGGEWEDLVRENDPAVNTDDDTDDDIDDDFLKKEIDGDTRQRLLDYFCGPGICDETVLVTATKLAFKLPNQTSRELQHALAECINKNHCEMEREARYALSLVYNTKYFKNPDSFFNLCYVSVSRSSCLTCKRLFLEEDRLTSRTFFVDELGAPGSNLGKDLDDWLPTIPPLHLYCLCMIRPLFPFSLGNEEKSIKVTRLPSWEQEFISRDQVVYRRAEKGG
jgi:hypothetical protein